MWAGARAFGGVALGIDDGERAQVDQAPCGHRWRREVPPRDEFFKDTGTKGG
jgi:hypothetical protein